MSRARIVNKITMNITFTFNTCFVVHYANMHLHQTANLNCSKMTVFSSVIIFIFFFSSKNIEAVLASAHYLCFRGK